MNDFLDTLNSLSSHVSQTDIIALSAALAVSIQAVLNKIPLFKSVVGYSQQLRRHLLSVVIPFALAVGGSLATGDNKLELAPVIFLLGQLIYHSGRFLIERAISALTAPTETQPL